MAEKQEKTDAGIEKDTAGTEKNDFEKEFLEQMSVFPAEPENALSEASPKTAETVTADKEIAKEKGQESANTEEKAEAGQGKESDDILSGEPFDKHENEEFESLKAEVERLRGALELQAERERNNARMVKECGEFRSYFPEVAYESIPDEVWESVKGGIPLAYSYALYEKRTERARSLAQSVNSRNTGMSSGALSRNTDERYFSPKEVRSMSREQVKANYTDIIESMRHWN